MLVLESMLKTSAASGPYVFSILIGLAAFITSLSALVWALRRKP